MAEFAWEARARTGEVRKGVMEAETADMVHTRLKAQQLSPVKVQKKLKGLSLSFGSAVSEKELVIFVRQFATMIDAGLPLVQCLDILSSQGDNPNFNKVLKDIKNTVEQGAHFSEALKKHPKIFDTLFVNLVHAGEQGGILDTILQRLAIYIEKRVKLKRQVRSAMVYPLGVFAVAVIVLFILLTWVIPAFEKMFADMGASQGLPAITRFVINMSQFVVGNIIWIVLGVGAVVGSLIYSFRNPTGRKVWDRIFLSAPILGPVMRKIAVARFTRTLGTLLTSGVPILDALEILGRAAGNSVIETAIMTTADKIREGQTMAEPLLQTNAFPPMVVQMIGVGEQTGALDQMLNKIADF
ncbi:MAG: type II secretion system F family protein, partial [Myxococcales bacterium]|nr:type II secretion system F family protein [Myxococcales bacterium]